MKRHISSLDRKGPTRLPPKRFIIFCEGKNTEPEYFEALGREFDNALVNVIPKKAQGVAFTIATASTQYAKEHGLNTKRRARLDSFEQRDEVWAAFDRDEHPHFLEAIHLCEQHNVGVARSIPCFEIWLILHHQDFHRPDNHHDVQRHFSKICPEYDPRGRKTPNCAELVKAVELAEKRAQVQLKRRVEEGSEFNAPSTTVFKLTQAIKGAGTRKTS